MAAAGENWTWGIAAGMPQTVSLTLEKRSESPLRAQFHAGSVLVASSLGARAVVAGRSGVAPYAFFGGGVLYITEGDGGGDTGATGFAWGGAGLRFATAALTWFVELGILAGMDEDIMTSSTTPAAAAGVAFGKR